MKTLCIIPARGGSKGIPKKNLHPVGGCPLIDWSIKGAVESDLFSQIIVSSDSEEILDRARTFGVTALQRPTALASDTATSEAALLHAIEAGNAAHDDEIVFLQATSPLRAPKDLRGGLAAFRDQKLDSLFSSIMIEDWFVWEASGGELKSVTYDWRTRKRRQDIEKRYLENGSFYIFRPELLMRTGNRLGGKIGTYVMEAWKALEIDSYENLDIAEILIEHKLKKEWSKHE